MKITMDFTHTLILLVAVVYSASAYSKYGRTCKDIGCRPSETCVMAQDSCSWSQQEGKECGTYPTCKKSTTTNSSPGDSSDGTPQGTVTRKPYVPPQPASNPDINPNSGGHLYPSVPIAPNAPSAPSAPSAPFPNPSAPFPNPNPSYPTPSPGGSRYPGYDPNGGNRNPSVPPYDPYGSRDKNPYGGRDPYGDKNKGSSGGSGSSIGDIFGSFFGGGDRTRYGSGGSGGSGPGYSDIFNALSGGGGNRGGSGGGLSDILNSFGNRGGSGGLSGGSGGFSGGSGSGGSFSDILNSFGNRGSGGSSGFGGGSGGNRSPGLTDILFGRGGSGSSSFGNDYDNRRTQPQPQPQPQPSGGSGSSNGGFLSSLFGSGIGDSLLRNALSGNRGGAGSGGSGSDLLNSFRYGGLFNENTGHGATGDKPKVTVSGAGPGGYPTQAPFRPQSYPTNNQSPNQGQIAQNRNVNNAAPTSASSQRAQPYGWSVGQN